MFSPQYCLDEILPLAEAAYDPSKLPAGWELLDLIEPEDFGLIARNGATVVIAECGTRTPDQWAHDFDAEPVANPFGPGRVHFGFMAEHLKVRASIWSVLERVGYDSLIIIGHSLAGPMANYCAMDIAKNAPQYAARVTVYTFEGPKPGDAEFVSDYNQKFPNSWRIQNIRDVIPTLPPPPVFSEHEGTTIWVDGGHTMDVHVAHGLETGVKPGLLKLIAAAQR